MSDFLKSLVDKVVLVIMYDGRTMIGTLKGLDHQTTLVLTDCKERIFSEGEGCEEVALGLYIVRGDQICVIGEVDEEADAAVDWAGVQGSKPTPITYGVL